MRNMFELFFFLPLYLCQLLNLFNSLIQEIPPIRLNHPPGLTLPPVVWICIPFICPKFPYPSKAGSVTFLLPYHPDPSPQGGLSQHLGICFREWGSLWDAPTPCWLSRGWQHNYTQRSRHGVWLWSGHSLLLGSYHLSPMCPGACWFWGKAFCFPGGFILLYIWDVLETNQFLSAPSPSCSWGVQWHHPVRARGIIFSLTLFPRLVKLTKWLPNGPFPVADGTQSQLPQKLNEMSIL